GEVHPCHRCPEPGQRDRVGADMALQVDAAQPPDVTEQRQGETHNVAQIMRIGDETLDVGIRGGRVWGDPLIPVRTVDGRVVIHRSTVPHAIGEGLRLSGLLATMSRPVPSENGSQGGGAASTRLSPRSVAVRGPSIAALLPWPHDPRTCGP